jgi:hypothetical protein
MSVVSLKPVPRHKQIGNVEGWVKRDIGIIYVGFAYLNAPQKFEIATK